MALLFAAAYDPATAVTKATTAALAMTAIDTANLRATFTAPANGRVLVRHACTWHGGTAVAALLLGVLEGATVRARFAPETIWPGAPVATSLVGLTSLVPVTGLSPGTTYVWDAAYGVETVSAAGTGIKYGGPNNAVVNDAFGAYVFEVHSAP